MGSASTGINPKPTNLTSCVSLEIPPSTFPGLYVSDNTIGEAKWFVQLGEVCPGMAAPSFHMCSSLTSQNKDRSQICMQRTVFSELWEYLGGVCNKDYLY